MPSPAVPVAVIIAGGKSRRMGQDKALLRLPDGRTALETTTRLAMQVAVEVYLALDTPTHAEHLRRIVNRLPAVVFDPDAGEGPLVALAGALRRTHASALLLLAVDMPLLTPPLLRYLVARAAGYDAAVFTLDGEAQPLPGWYSATIVPELEALVAAGERRLRAVLHAPAIRALQIQEVEFRAYDPEGLAFGRANTPQEWEALCARVRTAQAKARA
jgi:molybdopterin-guanine dinucleotide biosynthesis protein A